MKQETTSHRVLWPWSFITQLYVCISICVCVCGCDSGSVGGDDASFGKIRGNSGYGAIDGISGFVHLLQSKGQTVKPSSRISPTIERYDTVIWAPDRTVPPRQEVIERLQEWVSGGNGRRNLIFIGPGFRSQKLLDRRRIEIAKDEDIERVRRRYSEKLISYRYDSDDYHWGNNQSCDWYELATIESRPIKKVTGAWSKFAEVDELELYTGRYDFAIPSGLTSGGSGDAQVLLEGDGHNLLYHIPGPQRFSGYEYYQSNSGVEDWEEPGGQDELSESGIYIVANGSFVQNYGLVNPANQVLASRLADVCQGDVLVLQSGPGPIRITNSLAPEKNGWAWLKQRPLRDIVPFFLLLATFTFFVVFPIHGRPKRLRLRPEKTFADHVRATGQLLESTKEKSWAEETLKKCIDGSSEKKSSR